MKKLLLLPLVALALCACPSKASQPIENTTDTVVAKPEPKHITLLFAGDLMQHGTQYKAARQPDGSYNYDEVFRYIKGEINSADVSVANFETTLAGGQPSTFPRFNSPDEYLLACRDAGFDILLTANNHSADTGSKGITRTIEQMDKAGVPHIGTYVDQAERDKEYPYILEQNGFRIALLCYTYGTNGLPVPKPHIVNPIDTVQIRKDIKKAKSQKVDCIIACVHWGIEHALQPNKQQRDLADWMLRNGIDHVIGGHPHVVEPIEVRENKDGSKHLLAYSLGNYVSNMPKPNNDGGLMVKMQLTKDPDGNTTLTDASYSLIWVSRPVDSHHKNYRIYPVSVPDSMMNAAERARFHRTLDAERKLFQQHNKGTISETVVPWNKDWEKF